MTTVAMEIEAKHVLPSHHEHEHEPHVTDPLEMTTDALKQLVVGAVDSSSSSSAVGGPQDEQEGDAFAPVSENQQQQQQQQQQLEAEDDMASSPVATATGPEESPDANNNSTSVQEIEVVVVDEESDDNQAFAVGEQRQQGGDESSDCDWQTSSCSESPSRFSFIDFPAKVRASFFSAPRKPRKLKRKKAVTRASVVVDTVSSPSSVSKPTLTSMPTPLLKKQTSFFQQQQQQVDEPDKNVEKFKHFWDEKLRNTMEKITSLHKSEANGSSSVNGGGGAASFEQQNDVFHLLLKLYAHQDIVEELYSSCESNATEFEFYIPQLCTFLLHGNYAKQHQLECFLMSRSGESLPFAHRLTWFLRSFCEDAKSYQSEYLSVTASPDQENSDLLSAIEQRAGVPALLMNNGLCNEEVSVSKPSNLLRRRSSVFAIDEEMDPRVLESDESFADHLQSKRQLVVYEARPEEGSSQQSSLYKQTPDFVSALTDLADRLIATPLAQRVPELHAGLKEIQDQVLPSDVLYLPIGNTHHRVKAIHVDECFTFSTKERVPYFLVVEVLDYSVVPTAASPKKKKSMAAAKAKTTAKPATRAQPRGFSLILPFKKHGRHDVADVSQLARSTQNGHTSDSSVSESTPRRTSERLDAATDSSSARSLLSISDAHLSLQSSPEGKSKSQIGGSGAQTVVLSSMKPSKTSTEKESEPAVTAASSSTSTSYAPAFLVNLLGGGSSKKQQQPKTQKPQKGDLKGLDAGVLPLTPKDPLDGEEGDDEKEVEDNEAIVVVHGGEDEEKAAKETPTPTTVDDDAAEKEANELLEKANEEQKMRMGQWSLPRAGRRKARSNASASARSGGQFDTFYSSWFSKKQKHEKDEVCTNPESALIAVESPEEKTSSESVAVEVDEESKPAEEQAEPAAASDKLAKQDNDTSQDEGGPRKRDRDLSMSLDFTDSNAWKVKFDLEDGLTDNERDEEDDDTDSDNQKEKKIASIPEDTATKEESEEAPVIVFRERWSEKEARIRKTSPFSDHPGWRLLSVIVKSNDDLRQEQFAAQLIAQCDRIFKEYALPLTLRPYNVIATSAKTGLIEAVPDTVSLDSLKRNDPDYTTLLDFYHRLHGDKDSVGFARAQRNFVESLAAYSMVCYVFQIKDRHNGNILLDTQGHVIHIDFGFLLTNSPGSNLNFEKAPFKLTDEFVELMGGPRSSTFRYFRSLCIRAFLALQRNMEKIVLLVEMMLVGNDDLPCFAGGKRAVIEGLRARLKPGERTSACQLFVNQLIDQSINNWRTRWYDKYQRACLGIL